MDRGAGPPAARLLAVDEPLAEPVLRDRTGRHVDTTSPRLTNEERVGRGGEPQLRRRHRLRSRSLTGPLLSGTPSPAPACTPRASPARRTPPSSEGTSRLLSTGARRCRRGGSSALTACAPSTDLSLLFVQQFAHTTRSFPRSADLDLVDLLLPSDELLAEVRRTRASTPRARTSSASPPSTA